MKIFWKSIKRTCYNRACWRCRAGALWLLYSSAPVAESALWNERRKAEIEGLWGLGVTSSSAVLTLWFVLQGLQGPWFYTLFWLGGDTGAVSALGSRRGRCARRPLRGEGEWASLGLHTGEEPWENLPPSRDAQGWKDGLKWQFCSHAKFWC